MTEITTIGYEVKTLKQFLALLRQCRIECLVDIREMPVSRKLGFSKSPLSTAVEIAGIKYLHVVELGCPRLVRDAYRSNGDWAAYTRSFKKYLATQDTALSSVAKEAVAMKISLMCFEEDFNYCHRRFVAEALLTIIDGPARVSHLTGPMAGRLVNRALSVAPSSL